MTMPIAASIKALRNLVGDERGSMVVEMAILAPILVLLALGSVDISRMISRQHELQAGVAEAEAIALVAKTGVDTTSLKSVLMQSLNLSTSQVDVDKQYRCNADTSLVSSATSCSTNAVVSTYVKITLRDSYSPFWQRIGAVGTWNYNIVRMVQLS